MSSAPLTLLDGAMGTALGARGLRLDPPRWSAHALIDAPEAIAEVHAAYAQAGATVHTANTFRTTARAWGPGWAQAAAQAVAITRRSVPAGHRVAASLAPVEDCYSPSASPVEADALHAALAEVLAAAGPDLLLCETFPHLGEAQAAVRAALATGLPVWLSLSPGPGAPLLSPAEVERGAAAALDAGVAAVLVNCSPPDATLAYVEALVRAARSHPGAPIGAYANAGPIGGPWGWGAAGGPEAYAGWAARWSAAGATLIGGCCGTSPATIQALRDRLAPLSP
jgi:S-methylmethionine-dependent homocysteine/selenocysteine methylase